MNNRIVFQRFRGKSFPREKALTYQTFGVPIDDVGFSCHKPPTEIEPTVGLDGAFVKLSPSPRRLGCGVPDSFKPQPFLKAATLYHTFIVLSIASWQTEKNL